MYASFVWQTPLPAKPQYASPVSRSRKKANQVLAPNSNYSSSCIPSSSRPAHEERSRRANGPVELAHLASRRLGGRPQVDVVLIRSRRLGGRCPISDAVGSLGCQGEGLGSALFVVYVRQGAMRVVVWWEVEREVHYDRHFVSIGGARGSAPLSSPWVRGFGGRGRARLCQHGSCLAGAEIDVGRWYGFVYAACVSGFGDIYVYGAATDRSGSRWDG
jgi:hypothetical protein